MIKYGLDTDKVYENKSGCKFRVTEITSSQKIKIVFYSGYSLLVTSSKVKSGRIKDHLAPSVCGFGINDAHYKIRSGKGVGPRHICPFYRSWYAMISRCYSEGEQQRNPSYAGCSVCDEWRYFSNFRRWMMNQDWKNKQLDKDIIIVNNKIYSPSTCAFVEPWVNKLLSVRSSSAYFDSRKASRIRKAAETQEPRVKAGLIRHAEILEKSWNAMEIANYER